MWHVYQSAVPADSMPRFDDTRALISLAVALGFLTFAALPRLVLHKQPDKPQERRVFWAATGAATLALLLGSLPEWPTGIGLGLLVLLGMSLAAYFYTPYIKVNGKIYAYSATDRHSGPSENDHQLIAANHDTDYDQSAVLQRRHSQVHRDWWALVILVAMLEISFVSHITGRHSDMWGLISPIIFIAICVLLGYIDANYAYPIARGQRLPFAIVTVMTAGCFAIFYLPAYYGRKHYTAN